MQQGSGGDAYHMYPLFSGLCGYVFPTNSAGNLDPSDERRREPEVPQERLHDRQVEQGRPHPLEASIPSISKDLFLKGKTAYFFTGPWNLSDIRKTPGLRIKISAFPSLGTGCKSVPFLGVQGLMVTKFAALSRR